MQYAEGEVRSETRPESPAILTAGFVGLWDEVVAIKALTLSSIKSSLDPKADIHDTLSKQSLVGVVFLI